MAKTIKKTTTRRKSALWVQEYHHMAVNLCARALGLSQGEFVELVLDKYIEESEALAPIQKALKTTQVALTKIKENNAASD